VTSEISPHIWLPEPRLTFHPDRDEDSDLHPLRGLLRYGPYSANLVPGPIRVATIAPGGEAARLYSFMRELNSTFSPTERKDYLPNWPSFSAVFGLHMRAAAAGCHIELEAQVDRDFDASAMPHIVLAERLLRAIQGLESRRSEFDVLFLLIPTRWARGFVWGNRRRLRSS
jgi:hypothetical protein